MSKWEENEKSIYYYTALSVRIRWLIFKENAELSKKNHLPIPHLYYKMCVAIENTPEPHPESVSTVREDSIDKWKLHITQTEWWCRNLAQKQAFISDHFGTN